MKKNSFTTLLLCMLFYSVCHGEPLKFPDGFMIGAASSAYQVEGAWNEDGKGESIWDTFAHDSNYKIIDGTTGDIACDSYHHINEDVAMLKELGSDFYRFSIAWSRLLPNGLSQSLNPYGVLYYNNLIDELLRHGIKPIVTLYHWDLPAAIQQMGGWPNPLISDYFADYARMAFRLFGDRVKSWITVNEPYHVCQLGYGVGTDAPGFNQTGDIGSYMCSYTVLLAHAKAYHIYDKEFRAAQKGEIGMTIDTFWFEPKDNSSLADREISEITLQNVFGWFAHPILSESGDFPAVMKQRILQNNRDMNFTIPRLPELSREEIEMIKGTSDFLGLNHYSAFLVTPGDGKSNNIIYRLQDTGVDLSIDPTWEATGVDWLHIVPTGFRKLLNWIKKEYNNPRVFVTENGCADTDGNLNDFQRVRYYTLYMEEMLKAIHEDDCNIIGYTAWSLMDNYEWGSGYSLKFGLFNVDFSDPDRKRTPKASAKFFKKVLATRHIEHDYDPVHNTAGNTLHNQFPPHVQQLLRLSGRTKHEQKHSRQ